MKLKDNKKTKAITIKFENRVGRLLYPFLRLKCAKNNITITSYVLSLIQKDLSQNFHEVSQEVRNLYLELEKDLMQRAEELRW